MTVTTCPGAENSRSCDNHACRLHGCQGGGGRRHPASDPGAKVNMLDHGAAAAAEHGLTRSPHWPHVRAEQIKRQPVCQASGLTAADGAQNEAHHIFPFHLCVLLGRPDLELDLRNLITLARAPVDPHLLLGHLDDFRSSNLDVVADCVRWHGKSDAEIKADPLWQGKHAGRMKPWAEWNDQEKLDFRAHLDKTFPPAVVILPHAGVA